MTIPQNKRPRGDFNTIPSKRPSEYVVESIPSKYVELKKEVFAYKVPDGYGKVTISESKERGDYVKELEKSLRDSGEKSWGGIDRIMRAIAKEHEISPKKLHDDFKKKHEMIPDEWVKSIRKSR